jgi:uncharacterized protein YfaS (alpha-2-macroglobulin family)
MYTQIRKHVPARTAILRIATVIAAAAIVIAAVSAFAVSRAIQKPSFPVSTIAEVEEITANHPGRLDPIVVRFAKPVANPDAIAEAVRLIPEQKGTWALRDANTIEFTPTDAYRGKSSFTLAVDTGILSGTEAKRRGFTVNYSIRPADYTIATDGLYAEDGSDTFFSFSGTVTTDIPVSVGTAREMISASLGPSQGGGKRQMVEWAASEKASTSHRFTIRHIPRAETDKFLTVAWNGGAVDSKQNGKKSWLVPSSKDFTVLEIATEDPTCVRVRFSDPVDRAQDLRGLVRTGNEIAVRYSVDSNVVNLYNTDGWQEGAKITVLEGIRSAKGKTLKHEVVSQRSAAWDKPEVQFKDKGVILPTSAGVTIPVETKNVEGVIVEAYRIYADNVLQFLQVNELDGSYELERVGEPIWSSSFSFSWDDSMKNRWVARGLDLSPLVKKYPEGMYQIRVTFRYKHIKYECPVSHPDFSSLPMPNDEIPTDKRDEKSYWDYYSVDWDDRYDYWDYRNDPCHPAYYLYNYHNDIIAKKNVLVSDIGVMAKKDSDGAFHVTVADIRTTQPVAGAAVTAWSYTQQKIADVKTDASGFVTIPFTRDPFVIEATKDGQTSYLKIDDGAALSVSHFAVDGEKPDKGVKGFIYGERGVWRPGDDIHLVFVLQDPESQIPAAMPVNFELENPQGQVTTSGVYTDPVGGFYRIDTKTDEDDDTGSWTARVSIGGRSWTKQLRIEAVVPNRLSINLKTDKPYLGKNDNAFTLTSAWLHGAPAPGLNADMSVSFYPASTTFPGYADYSFVNPETKLESEEQQVWEGTLDKNSTAKFSLDLNAGENLPGKLKARLTTRVFEPSGMFSIEQVDYAYSPYARYIGVKIPQGDAARGMLLTDKDHRIDIAVVDADGKPSADNAPVSVEVYKLQWQWWWEKDALTDASFVEDRSTSLIRKETVTPSNGRASCTFQIKYPDWGRYIIIARDTKDGGHSSAKIVYVDWPGWAGRGQESGTGSAAMLPLTLDKASYKTGETARISFSTTAGARALVTIEKDGRVLSQDWMDTAAGTSVYKFAVTPEMAPNVYAHITLLQKHMQTANSLPIRLYGVIPVMAENPDTRLAPVIATADEYGPGKKCSITVSESSGKAMTFTLAVVDEGLLGLTRFKAQNPWNEFYKKEASRLASWDIYRYVTSAFGGRLETLLSIGGAEDLLNGNDKKAERFKPVVLFFGPFELPANAKKEISFTMPEYVGAVRTMVVAGKSGAYGTAERSVPVRGDLMVLPTLPRTIGTNETVEVPVTIFNGRDKEESVTLTLSSTGAIASEQSQKVSVPASGDKTVTFRIGSSIAGVAKIRIVGKPDNAKLAQSESVTEIDILSRGSPIVTARRFTVLPGKTYRDYVPSPGDSGTKTMTVEFATMPVLDLRTRMQYLVTYPHGCIEQITSGGFAQLLVPAMAETTEDEIATIKKNVMSVIDRYPKYQTSSGGFGYWPGSAQENEWGTSWAGHFMLEAKKCGYEVPDTVYAPWLAYQKDKAQAWQNDESTAETQAYRLYTLALAGEADLGAMNRLSTLKKAPADAWWLLAGAYALAGQKPMANDIVTAIDSRTAAARNTDYTWGSPTRDSAVMLNTLNILGDDTRVAETAAKLAESFGSEHWYSTHETGWSLLALKPFYEKNSASGATYDLEWDKGSESGTIGAKTVVKNLEAFDSPTQTLVVKNTGSNVFYGKVTTRGIMPAGSEKALQTGLALTVQYVNKTGRVIQPRELAPGDTFTLQIKVTNLTKKQISNVALSVPVPTCWEFANDRIAGDTAPVTTLYTYRDIRDTVINTYFDMKENEVKNFSFTATIAYNGNYYVPAIRAAAMYDADYQALEPGQLVTRIAGSGTSSGSRSR